jgi:hypothetical protein
VKRSDWRRLIRRPPPRLAKHLRFRGPLNLGPAPDPNRRRRSLPPTASLEEHIEDFVDWLIAGGTPPGDAKAQGDYFRELHRKTGVNFLTLPPEKQLAFIVECDRRLDELEREEAEDLSDVDPGAPEH